MRGKDDGREEKGEGGGKENVKEGGRDGKEGKGKGGKRRGIP